ncbi:hypothetical protein [Pseudooceanicola sp.]|uniref:hypothetical protein n=1 Tax=Pseudooceanicola sp. TaxID=1914328 RepID=UPI00405866A3
MDWLLIWNNITSSVVILACWWLAHVNARSSPPGRAIAAGYSLIGISVLFTMVVRNLAMAPSPITPWLIVVTKGLLAVTLLLTIYRRAKLGDR